MHLKMKGVYFNESQNKTENQKVIVATTKNLLAGNDFLKRADSIFGSRASDCSVLPLYLKSRSTIYASCWDCGLH